MLSSFPTDLIAVKVECGEFLRQTKRMRDWVNRYGCYIVLFQSIGKMLSSLWTDLISGKLQCGECLRERKRMRHWMKS